MIHGFLSPASLDDGPGGVAGLGSLDLSYATAVGSRVARGLVRTLERASGRRALLGRLLGYEREVGAGLDIWQVLVRRYGLRLDVIAGTLDAIPAEGPLVVVANHPFGILDGLMLGHILSRRRPDGFRLLAHHVVAQSPDLAGVVLPVSFDPTPEARRMNLATRARALAHLQGGGAVGLFPGGTVSTAVRPFGPAYDPVWRTFAARLVARSGARVVPVYFDGANSRLFQIASHLHYALRLGLLMHEFRKRLDQPVRVAIGTPIGPEVLAPVAGDAEALIARLRDATYSLAPRPLTHPPFGHEFEAFHRRRQPGQEAVAAQAPQPTVTGDATDGAEPSSPVETGQAARSRRPTGA